MTPKNDLSDRERIWMYLLGRTAVDAPGAAHRQTIVGDPPAWRYPGEGEPHAGQIVVGMTSAYRLAPHQHVVGECVGRSDPGPDYNEHDVPLIRAFGDDDPIFFFNETFYIWGEEDWESNPVFFEGWKQSYYHRVRRCMEDVGDPWKYKFQGLRFAEATAILTIRSHNWFPENKSFKIGLPATPKTLKREIIAALKGGGYGTYWEKAA